MHTFKTLIQAPDPLSRAGVAALLDAAAGIVVIDDAEAMTADVVVLLADAVSGRHWEDLRRRRESTVRGPGLSCVVVTDDFDETTVLNAVRNGVSSVLPTACASAERLTAAVIGAGDGSVSLLPRGLQAALLHQLNRLVTEVLEPSGMTLSGLSFQEIDTIQLVADGLRTAEIASKLSCSEGVVNDVLRGVLVRLGLTSRVHAVAYALRAGTIG